MQDSDVYNLQSEFCAVLIHCDLDETCPVVTGAEKRISPPSADSRPSDNTAQENEEFAI